MHRRAILFVDDELNILHACRRVFRKEGYEIETSDSPGAALRLVGEREFSVVVSDQRMPGMSGTEFLARVREIAPNAMRMILTGYADVQAAIDAINQGAVSQYLQKPWNDDHFRAAVRQAVSQYELVRENERLQKLTAQHNRKLKELNQQLEKRVAERTRKVTGLNQQLEKSFLGSIQILAALSEMHSPIIGNHSKRVAKLSKKIAERLGIQGRALIDITVAATLHDIGKIGVPAGVLSGEPGRMSPQERAMLKSHVVKGEHIAQLIPNLGSAAVFIRHHHEHYNGTGYPEKLQGKTIPVGSRIIAVADAYDKALNKMDSFQSATPREALKEVKYHASEWYDPDIVDLLEDYVADLDDDWEEGREIEIRLKDLRRGMRLSRDLGTGTGILLLAKDHEIDRQTIQKIFNHQQIDPIVDGIFVYRRKSGASREGEPDAPTQEGAEA